MGRAIPPDVWPYTKEYEDVDISKLLCTRCAHKMFCPNEIRRSGCYKFEKDEKLIITDLLEYSDSITMGFAAIAVRDLIKKGKL
jgi:hypothetical protein